MNKLTPKGPIWPKTIEYLFYLFVFLLPWQTRWIWHYGQLGSSGPSEYLTFSLYGTEILFFLVLVLAFIYRCKTKDDEIRFLNYKILDFYVLFFLFLALAALSIIWAPSWQTALYYLIKLLEGLALLILVINFQFSLKKIGWALVLSGTVQSLLGIYQFFTQQVLANKWLGLAEQLPQTLGASVVEFDGSRLLRAYGAFTHPNILGGFLAVCLIVLIVLIILAQRKKEKSLLWLFLPTILAGLFFTFSKSAFLALIISLVFLAIFIFTNQAKPIKIIFSQIILVIFAVLAILFLIYPQPVITRLQGEARLEQKSFTERANYLEQAKDLIKNNWLQGVGLGNYTLALYNQSLEKSASYDYQPVHNVYLLVFVELGILGFLIFILIIVKVISYIWSFPINKNLELLSVFSLFKFTSIYDFYLRRFYWFLGLTAIFIMILVLMVFDHYFWTQYFGIMLWWLGFGLWLKQVSLIK